MHASHLDPLRTLVVTVAALILALAAAAALPGTLGDVNFGTGGRADTATAAGDPSTPTGARAEPAWLRDPLASPLHALTTSR
jgi:hypothetical protein